MAIVAGCAHVGQGPAASVSKGHLQAFGVGGRADPTEHGARVIPESADEDRAYGVEPNGGIRGIASGVRVINLPNGAALAAEDRLPQAPSATTAVPDRLGGGFLFVLGNVVWRTDRWLSPARPVYTSTLPISRVVVGLDRVYLRAANGSPQAFDPRNGAPLDLGPWPASSFVGQYAALDGWRAVAINDLRGAVVTVDAGATWKPLGLPIDPQNVTIVDDAIAVGGTNAARQTLWFEVRGNQVSSLAAPPAALAAERPTTSALAPAARPFGKRPLLAAIEDGWPLADGTAVVARDGALARVRLEDGALVDLAPDAFPLKPARCHPIPLASTREPSSPGAFGFVCGEPHGRTVLYGYDPRRARLEELRRFSSPRVVVASGNGALAVRGGCAEDAPSQDEDRAQQSYCLRPRVGAWREVRIRNGSPPGAADAVAHPAAGVEAAKHGVEAIATDRANEAGDERVVVLGDGRVAIVSPPHGDLSAARLTLLDPRGSTTVPITFAAAPPDVAHALKLGIWLDGMEEHRPGVIGGWVDVAGTMLGFELDLQGHASAGAFIRDAGAPMVSGRYGLGWSASRRGYETVDGGMTWTPIELPEPIALDQTVRVRACGPIGCTAKGWLRVGWGAPANPTPAIPPPSLRAGYRPGLPMALECDGTSPPPPPVDEPFVEGRAFELDPWGRRLGVSTAARPFFSVPAPPHRPDEVELSTDANDPVERQARTSTLARLYAWGPKVEDWPHAGHWQARWLWPFGGWQDVHSTQLGTAPYANAEAARHALGGQQGVASTGWTFGIGDDAAHGLLFGRHGVETTVLELEGERPIVEVRRGDGEPFADVDAALRVAGHWYLATPQGPGELAAEVIWQVDGTVARELTRVGRSAVEGRPSGARLARRSDGRAVGLVVDGQPGAEHTLPLRWVLPIDLETSQHSDPEPLGLNDLEDRFELLPCNGDELGWVLDTPLAGSAHLHLSGLESTLATPFARIRVSTSRACIERLSGTVEALSRPGFDVLSRRGSVRGRSESGSIQVSALTPMRTRLALRCWRAVP